MMTSRAALLALSLLAGARPVAQPAERWALEIRWAGSIEHGELRFDSTGAGRLLLESNDSVFLALATLQRTDSSIAFQLPASRRRFTGTIVGAIMSGTVIDADGSVFIWDAERIAPGTDRWPVAPRVTVRQLELGSDAATVKIPGAWYAALPDTARLWAGYDSLARRAGLVPRHGADLLAHETASALGLETTVAAAMQRVLEAIAASPAADAEFHHIFDADSGMVLDLHHMAIASARRWPPFSLDRAGEGLSRLGILGRPLQDSAAVMEAAWRLWVNQVHDSEATDAMLQRLALADSIQALNVATLLHGYGGAVRRWQDAVHWLLTHPWIPTALGAQSPVDLVEAFWGRAALTLPAIQPTALGSAEAFPVTSVAPLLGRLVLPANAVAPEWLQGGGAIAALDTWHGFDWGEPFRLVLDGRSRYITSPAVETHSHSAGFLNDSDAIVIDPGVAPLEAIPILIHEWQHIIVSRLRLTGAGPGFHDSPTEIRLHEDDPWLGEGIAEWATERILLPTRADTPLLAAADIARRLAIQARDGDDPHALGYRLVRAAADRVADPQQLRDRLVHWLQDLPGFAHASGLDTPGPAPAVSVVRPVNAAVIPEVTFIWSEGAALDVHRRLRISTSPSEH